MSFALNFTQDINDISTMKQKPLRKAPGGAIPSNQIISEAPPEDIITTPDPVLEKEPVVKPFDMMMMEPQYPVERNIEPEKSKIDPQLQMILQAQNDMTGVNAIQNEKGLVALFNRTYDV